MFRLTRAVILIALVSLAAASTNDDFAFEVSDDLEVEISEENESGIPLPPRKLNGIPDVSAIIGKVFQFAVPEDAFTGNIVQLEVKSPLPSWLFYDYKSNEFTGVPISTDKSDVLVTIVAHGGPAQDSAFDVFKVHLENHHDKIRVNTEQRCDKNPLVLTIFLDQKIDNIKPNQRLDALQNLAGYLAINNSAFTFGAQKPYSDILDSSILLAGPGNVKKRSSKQTSHIELIVGCENKLWDKYISMIHQLKEQAKDGTLSEVLNLPVLGWRIQTVTGTLERGRRETPIDDSLLSDYEYDEDDYDEEFTTIMPKRESTSPVPPISSSSGSSAGSSSSNSNIITATSTPNTSPSDHFITKYPKSETTTHPHRHHHGELPKLHETKIAEEEKFTKFLSSTQQSIEIEDLDNYDYDNGDYDVSDTDIPDISDTDIPDLQEISTKQTTTFSYVYDKTTANENFSAETTSKVPENVIPDISTTEKITFPVVTITEYIETSQKTIPTTITETTVTTTTTTTTTTPAITTPNITTFLPPTSTETTTVFKRTVPPIPTSTTEYPTTVVTEPRIDYTITSPTTTSVKTSPTSTTPLTTTTTTTPKSTTRIEYEPMNFPPTINHRLKKIRITAGTVLSYFIPDDTFTDFEDGNDLKLKFFDAEHVPIKQNYWIQFNEKTREVYGLPLEDHVSKWEFVIQATDKEGASEKDILEVSVQQHKGRRTVTHEFTLQMRVEKKHEFPTAVDWQLRTLRGLAKLFNNKDISQIVVRNIDFSSDFVTFTWTNDTLPRSYCPKNELDYIYNIMVANNEGDPSYALSQALAPELRVKNVEYKGIGQCEVKQEIPQPPPKASPTNFSPIPRNPVDHIDATVGELLIFRVPDDTFYDPEDGDARNLKMSLLTMDRQPLSSDHWLQFDVKNQEFYGIPLAKDVGRSEYQLVCEDRGGLTANDGLVVAVNSAPRIYYNVEFSMTLETPYETFVNSASIKRKFVEKLRDLFRDKDTSNIHINSIIEGSTVVSWNNNSLPTDRCPDTEIKKLREVLVNDDETLADRVEVIMGPEFPVAAISLTPTGLCQGELTVVHNPDIVLPIDESASPESSDEYLIAFVVPAVIIAAMLLLAGIVACVLYRRRRTGKMNVEEDERQSFRSKGIPVIFQDEIDEKPESGTKAPVILKEEKPPLAPPEYSKGGTPVQQEENEDTPYQPPPPFTSNQDNGRQPRPKPTPTYRKPPPYVPP